jgi:hypothetical protein
MAGKAEDTSTQTLQRRLVDNHGLADHRNQAKLIEQRVNAKLQTSQRLDALDVYFLMVWPELNNINNCKTRSELLQIAKFLVEGASLNISQLDSKQAIKKLSSTLAGIISSDFQEAYFRDQLKKTVFQSAFELQSETTKFFSGNDRIESAKQAFIDISKNSPNINPGMNATTWRGEYSLALDELIEATADGHFSQSPGWPYGKTSYKAFLRENVSVLPYHYLYITYIEWPQVNHLTSMSTKDSQRLVAKTTPFIDLKIIQTAVQLTQNSSIVWPEDPEKIIEENNVQLDLWRENFNQIFIQKLKTNLRRASQTF